MDKGPFDLKSSFWFGFSVSIFSFLFVLLKGQRKFFLFRQRVEIDKGKKGMR